MAPEDFVTGGAHPYVAHRKRQNMNQRTIAVFTGNLAEYGLQYPILRAIDRHPDLDYLLLVSGAHLDPNFGSTLDEIYADGFHIDAEAERTKKTTTIPPPFL